MFIGRTCSNAFIIANIGFVLKKPGEKLAIAFTSPKTISMAFNHSCKWVVRPEFSLANMQRELHCVRLHYLQSKSYCAVKVRKPDFQ